MIRGDCLYQLFLLSIIMIMITSILHDIFMASEPCSKLQPVLLLEMRQVIFCQGKQLFVTFSFILCYKHCPHAPTASQIYSQISITAFENQMMVTRSLPFKGYHSFLILAKMRGPNNSFIVLSKSKKVIG